MRALITGASSGLGRAMAVHLSANGAHVVSVDRSRGEPLPRLLHIDCDLADRAALDAAMPAILAAGGFDMAIFNAGISATGRFEDIPADASRRVLSVNAEAPMVLCSALMHAGAVRAHLCFISSLSHYTGYPGAAAYAASKDALAVYAKSVRKSFGRRGVTVTLACPGPLRTEHAERHAPPGADAAARMPAAEAALTILAATLSGNRLVIPGSAPKLAALTGRLLPALAARQMKRLIYDRLERSVW